MPSQLKEMMMSELTDKVGRLNDCAFVDFKGLNAQGVGDLRLKLHETDSRLFVVKNRLAMRVLPDELQQVLPGLFTGSTGVVHGDGDPSTMLKTLIDWGKKNRAAAVKGGMIDGKAMTAQQVAQVAALPSRDMLRAQLLAVLTAPMTNLLRLLNEPKRRLVSILDQKLKGAEDADSAPDAEPTDAEAPEA